MVADRLTDALGRDPGALQLQRQDGYAVEVQNYVRALLVVRERGYFFGYGKLVGSWIGPVDQPDRLIMLTETALNLHAVANLGKDMSTKTSSARAR
jgi:hypothetical protein